MTDQGELWKELSVDTSWFHVVRGMILGGDMKRMGLNAWGAYCVIKAHSSMHNGESWPSVMTIAGHMGVSKATAERAIKTLVDAGIVERIRNHKHKSTTYQIKESIPMTLNGEVVAKADRKYEPFQFEAFTTQLKKFAESGLKPVDGKITINLTVNVINQGDNGTVNIGDVTISSASDPIIGDEAVERAITLARMLKRL